MKPNKLEKLVYFLIFINVMVMVLYKIVELILSNYELALRGWIFEIYVVNILFLFINIVILINILLCRRLFSKLKNCGMQDLLKIFSTIIMIVAIVIVFFGGSFIASFSIPTERIVTMQNQKLIESSVEISFHTIEINYFKPVNDFVMKKTNLHKYKD